MILRNADGQEVATNTGASGTLQVPTCTSGLLGRLPLRLEVQLVQGDTVVDSYTQSVGVRTVKVDGIKFLINGEPFSFKGFGKHEDVPVIGKGHNDAYLLHDFELLKWIGANLPHLALPVLRGRPRLRRPAGHRADRRDRSG